MVHWSAAFLVLVPSNLDRPRQKKTIRPFASFVSFWIVFGWFNPHLWDIFQSFGG